MDGGDRDLWCALLAAFAEVGRLLYEEALVDGKRFLGFADLDNDDSVICPIEVSQYVRLC